MEIKLDNILDNECSFPIKRDYNGSKVIFIAKNLYLNLENIDNNFVYDIINTDIFIPVKTNTLIIPDNEIENNRSWLFQFIYKAAPYDNKYFYIRNAFYFIHYKNVIDYIFGKINITKNIANELVSVIEKYYGMDIINTWIRYYYDGLIIYDNLGPSQYQTRIFRDKKITIRLILLKDKYIHRANIDFYIDIDFNKYTERNNMYICMKTYLYPNMTLTRKKIFEDIQKDNDRVNNWKLDKVMEDSNIRNIYEVNKRF